ncbi:hypothetical protein [Halosimplex litoreum]|uniref:hypothetical protein n=1 Tax=Halosimplex litoreum TaxID=1198301 RepID=UPI001E40A2E4|nr:hypothetical protein [Halosimplex litoreum]
METVPDRSRTFLTASAVVVVLGTVLAVVTPLVADAPRAFVGSIVTSGLLGLVFTVRGLQLFRATGRVPLPATTLSIVFGIWFMGAPLLYDTSRVGFVATAGTQFAGLLVAAFGTYLFVHGVTATTE